MTTYICDWTHWQEMPCPADQIEKEGFSGVKLKVGGAAKEGWSFVDPTFHRSAENLFATEMVPMAYWYLVPGKPIAQAGLFVDLLRETNKKKPGAVEGWAPQLDVEQGGLSAVDVRNFLTAWIAITMDYPITVYTNAALWQRCTSNANGAAYSHRLEEAHWVSDAVRDKAEEPYASQHVKYIDPEWWTVNYGGWKRALLMQFTNRALVAGKRVPATVFPGTKAGLRMATS